MSNSELAFEQAFREKPYFFMPPHEWRHAMASSHKQDTTVKAKKIKKRRVQPTALLARSGREHS
jgi:hypothetical protein